MRLGVGKKRGASEVLAEALILPFLWFIKDKVIKFHWKETFFFFCQETVFIFLGHKPNSRKLRNKKASPPMDPQG
jgi:hypothetical protein